MSCRKFGRLWSVIEQIDSNKAFGGLFAIKRGLHVKVNRLRGPEGLYRDFDLHQCGRFEHQTAGIDVLPFGVLAEVQTLQLIRRKFIQHILQRHVALLVVGTVPADRLRAEIQFAQDNKGVSVAVWMMHMNEEADRRALL